MLKSVVYDDFSMRGRSHKN